jgi:hypothetical protein
MFTEEARNMYLSDEPVAIREPFYNTETASAIQIDIPYVELTGETSTMFKDSDSVSTFKTRGPTGETKSEASVTFVDLSEATDSTRTSPAPNIPINLSGNTEDVSVSKMSDTLSRISMLETQFSTIASNFTVATQELQLQAQ